MIKGLGIRIDGKCVDTAKIPLKDRVDENRKIRTAFYDAFSTALFFLPTKTGKIKLPPGVANYSTTMPDIGQVIDVKGVLKLFDMSDESSIAANKIIADNYGVEATGAVYDSFVKQVETLGLRVSYCSMTQHFCEDNAFGDNPC